MKKCLIYDIFAMSMRAYRQNRHIHQTCSDKALVYLFAYFKLNNYYESVRFLSSYVFISNYFIFLNFLFESIQMIGQKRHIL